MKEQTKMAVFGMMADCHNCGGSGAAMESAAYKGAILWFGCKEAWGFDRFQDVAKEIIHEYLRQTKVSQGKSPCPVCTNLRKMLELDAANPTPPPIRRNPPKVVKQPEGLGL